jgi:all-trans-retinol dehydrogenase (NAD+)
MTDIQGKRVLVTGAASGLGEMLATELARAGANLVLWDIDETGLHRVRNELVDAGYHADAYACDLADKNSIRSAAADTLSHSGPVDILINNAGIVSGKNLLDLSDEDIEHTFDINALALFWTVRELLPSMLERDSGHIVTIASAAGLSGAARLTDYSASKHAAVGFDESLRHELRKLGSNVRTTVVCPFFIDTGMFDGAKTRFSLLLPILKPEKVVRRVLKAIRRNKPRLLMPWFLYTGFPMRLLPVRWADALSDFFGVSRAMDEFHGRGEREKQ